MTRWKPEPWQPTFCLLPRFGVHGELIWGACERRKLTTKHGDGYDGLRDVETAYQFRRLDHDWPMQRDEWRPLPIPMLPANERDFCAESAPNRAKAERDALEMMERAKAMMRESER